MKLTDKQLEAVTFDGSIAVVAGAGTGKTAMLTRRFLHHVVNDGLSPLEVAAVTFTEKAAAELRSRIRKTLRAEAGEEAAAETDAAQISTIHSLAARICRDFYDLAQIPPDFRVLDETDAEILMAEWIDEAIGEVGPETVRALGYTWLRDALGRLLRDPSAAAAALEWDEKDWRKTIDEARDSAIRDLLKSDCWLEAWEVLNRCRGASGDKLEPHRVSTLNAMSAIANGQNVAEAVAAILAVKLNVGSKANWLGDSLGRVRDCLKALRDTLGDKGAFCALTYAFGAADAEACRRVKLLREAFAAAGRYIRLAKVEKRVLDFADLEQYAIQILEHREARCHYAERWKAILIDEFQDTNTDQERILDLLAEGGARLTIVGDGKQSVYGFRRADPRVFDRARQRIGREVILDRTFRTHRVLVECENQVFAEMMGEPHQSLTAERIRRPHNGPFLTVHVADGDLYDIDRLLEKEAGFIAAETRRMIDSGLWVWDKNSKAHRAIRPSDIAVLSRTRAPLDVYIDRLLAAGVPAVNAGGGDLLDTRVAMDVSAILRFASDPSDDIALVAILRAPFFAISDRDLQMLAGLRKEGETWWNLLSRSEGLPGSAYRTLADILAASRTNSAERLLDIVDSVTGYTAVIANLEQGTRRTADWVGFKELLSRFARLGRSDVVGADRYLRRLRAAQSVIVRPPVDAGNAVSLMTIHAAKGLEWPVVFVPNLCGRKGSDDTRLVFDAELGVAFRVIVQETDGHLEKVDPTMLKLITARRRSRDAEEAARILYVAITRARDRVVLTAAGASGNDLELLRAGLERAGVAIENIPDFDGEASATQHIAQPQFAFPAALQTDPVRLGLRRVPMSGLGEYVLCPKLFKFRHIDGHPGIAEGGLGGRLTGSLTHLALELDIATPEALGPVAEGAAPELCIEAARLANCFRDGRSFSEFRIGNTSREVPVRLQWPGLMLTGKADLVGDDWVLDFKTDSEFDPDRHLLQLWAYARALAKKRAVVAYLRHDRVFEYTPDQLELAAAQAEVAIAGIKKGHFQPDPSLATCGQCDFAAVCDACCTGTAQSDV